MAKMTAGAIELIMLIGSPDVNVSYSAGGFSPSMIASPVKGRMRNPNAATGGKLIRDGYVDASGTWLRLTPKGKELERELQAGGWTVSTGVGQKPSAYVKAK